MSRYSDVSDISTLSVISKDVLLQVLSQRYHEDIIYSFVADILISINPYKPVDNVIPSALSSHPHTYTVAKRMYNNILSTCTDQCCIISGESGAGKTEICKYLVRHLTELSRGQASLELRINQMNPLLEAFGNAQTVMNSNSSRFGKYLQLKFNQSGKVTGAKVNEYLLEKSRVVYQNPGERNFHVFYWVLGGLEYSLKMQLHIDEENNFRYLGGVLEFCGNEEENFKKLKDCLNLVGFDEKEQENIYIIVAAILHLGNVDFEIDQNEFAFIPSHLSSSLELAALLLGISSDSLCQLLTITVSSARTEIIRKHLSKTKAEATRDAISKALYDRLFRWIVNQINHLLSPKLEDMAWGCDIGILDIFGFENFQHNSFEQLCINLANEQLHNFFIQHIFHLEMEQYKEEGIEGVDINISDSQYLLESFLLGSASVFRLLDDQGTIPRANNLTFLQKLNQKLNKESFYTKSKGTASGQFTIHHYAGEVLYSVSGFLDKNMDLLPNGVKGTLENSQNSLVNLLFRASINPTGTLSLQRRTTGRMSRKTREAKGRKGNKTMTPTISSQFKSSLSVLVTKMKTASPHFIRCLKPNQLKKPNMFDDKFVQRQLDYTGMMATIQLRREGYSYRPSFEEFYERFGSLSLCNLTSLPIIDACIRILNEANIKQTEYQIGHSKLFLRHYQLEQLENQFITSHRAAYKLQAIVLGFLTRRRYKKLLIVRERHRFVVKNLFQGLERHQSKVVHRLERLNNQDEKRYLAGERDSMLLGGTLSLPKLSPPGDLYELPPPILLSDDEDNDQYDKMNSLKKKSVRLKMDDHTFVRVELRHRPAQKCHRQSRMLRSSVSSSHLWLHGMITQKKAERMLSVRPAGSFLVRINRKKLSHILCYKSCDKAIYHLPISQLPNGKFLLEDNGANTAVHNSIEDLVEYHSYTPLKGNNSDYLLYPCGEEDEVSVSGPNDTAIKIELTDKVAIV